jgi:hypothetical protein
MRKSFLLLLGSIMIAGIAFVTVSCEKDEDPAYVGKWAINSTEEIDGTTYDYRQVLDLKAGSFTSSEEIKINNTWKTASKIQGTVVEKSGKFTIHFAKIGFSTFGLDGMPTGTVVMYNEGSTEYGQLLEMMGMPSTFDAFYTITGNELKMEMDLNQDGDATDEDEGYQIFVKL